jgi:hypothetical protein
MYYKCLQILDYEAFICTQPNLSPPTLISGWGSDTLALQSYDIIALRLHTSVAALAAAISIL